MSVVELVANIALATGTGGTGTAAKAAAKTSAVAATKAASKGITKEAAKAAILKASRETGKSISESQLQQAAAAAAASSEDWDPYSLDRLNREGLQPLDRRALNSSWGFRLLRLRSGVAALPLDVAPA